LCSDLRAGVLARATRASRAWVDTLDAPDESTVDGRRVTVIVEPVMVAVARVNPSTRRCDVMAA
jgi:hypothetical protein